MTEHQIEEIRTWLDQRIPSVSTFVLRRTTDVTGVSGVGVVADGCVFPDGRTVTRWRDSAGVQQTCVWDSIQHVRRIHGHDGATRVEWVPYDVLVTMMRSVLDVAYETIDGADDTVTTKAAAAHFVGKMGGHSPRA